MKTSIKTITATIALTALMAGPASAMVSAGDVRQGIGSLGGDSNIFVNVDNDRVTLTGYFDSRTDKNRALRAAKATAGIDQVIDLTTVNN